MDNCCCSQPWITDLSKARFRGSRGNVISQRHGLFEVSHCIPIPGSFRKQTLESDLFDIEQLCKACHVQDFADIIRRVVKFDPIDFIP